MRLVLSLSALSVLSFGVASVPPRGPHYEHVFTLKPKEGVFAYARISPDGKRLAYASQISARPSAQRNWSVTAVDLTTQKTLFSENGIDAYWSNDGTRVIYSGMGGVTIRNVVDQHCEHVPRSVEPWRLLQLVRARRQGSDHDDPEQLLLSE